MTVALAFAIAAGVVVIALALLFVLRRLAPADGFWGAPEPNHSGSALALVGSAFAIFAAFVLFLVFQGFQSASSSAESEAAAVERLFHTAEGFEPRLRRELHGALVCYSRDVITDEWPAMERGEESADVDDWSHVLEDASQKTAADQSQSFVALEQFVDTDRIRETARRERLVEADATIPTLLWIVLIAAGTLVIAYLLSFANPAIRPWLQAGVIGAVAGVVTLILCVITFLDRPFAGQAGTITPSAMIETEEALVRALDREFAETPVPCERPDALG